MTESDMDLFRAMWHSDSFSQDRVDTLQREFMKAPAGPTAEEYIALSEHIVWERGQKQSPTWLSPVCQRREAFASTALRVTSPEGARVWKFVFAMQSPLHISLSPLEPQPVYLSTEPVAGTNWGRLARETVKHRFVVDFMQNIAAHDLPLVSAQEVEVLCNLAQVGGNVLETCNDDWLPLEDFLESLPPRPEKDAASEQATGKAASGYREALLRLHPWLDRCWKEKPSPHHEEELHKESVPDDSERLDDETVEELFQELDRRRAELAADAVEALEGEDFTVTILGGKWSMQHRGVAAAAVAAEARGALARDFCSRRGLPKKATFDFSAYPEGIAPVLARAWAHRMQHFYDCACFDVAEGGPEGGSAAAAVAAYVEPPEFLRVAGELRAHRQTQKRIEQIRGLFV